MLAVILSPLYFFGTWLIAFMFWRLLKAISEKLNRGVVKLAVGLVFGLASALLPIGFFLPEGKVKYLLQHWGSAWMGFLMFSMAPAFLYLIYCLIWKICKHRNGVTEGMKRSRVVAIAAATVGAAFTLIAGFVGIVNATKIETTRYYVTAEKKSSKLDDLKIVMAADMHMGVNIGVPEMRKMLASINACEPDIVVFCGDIFDNNYEALDDPEELKSILKSIKSKYGVFACYGNHDIKEPVLAGFTFDPDGVKESDPRMDALLEEAGVKLLMDEAVLIDDSFYVYGRPDYAKPGRGISQRKSAKELMAELGNDYPVIVLDHEPREQKELAEAGVDIDLCGHTHDGQIFPATIIVNLVYDNAYGLKKYGNMSNIVTSGVGLFGPYMRVGTIAEICEIEVSFK